MRKTASIIIAFVCGLISVHLHAQNIAVESFVLAQTDLTANTPGTMVRDQNGEICALIKVETTQKGFTFDVGVMGVTSVVEHPAEIWVYVPFGVRKITLQHPQLGMLRDYQIPIPVEKGRTYVMKLISGVVTTVVQKVPIKQFLSVELSPADAILELNGKVKVTDKGFYQELVTMGQYKYRVYSPNYHSVEGVVDVTDPNKTTNLKIDLKPAFGYLSVSAKNQPDIEGAAVYIDDKFVGNIPVDKLMLNSGEHTVRILKEMYEVHSENFTISDSGSRIFAPTLVPAFADVTLKTASGAEIYINGELKGSSVWKGRLATGSHVFETRMTGHIPFSTTYDITRNDHSKVINIDSPTPIYGSLVISSNPPKAQISINGVKVGETPKYITRQLIGEYNVTASLPGYKSQTKAVKITEGSESELIFELNEGTGDEILSSVPQEALTTVPQAAAPVDKVKVITSKEDTVYVGQKVFAELPEGRVARWKVESRLYQYIYPGPGGSLIPLKPGVVTIWGYVNFYPTTFKITILERP
ncbi:MAG: PEGA domain-containing protein [Bacteroidales bacterium]|nr:PEGA domain-containing protein [Bacteroidales bacterium]